jgi:hypothetical protein
MLLREDIKTKKVRKKWAVDPEKKKVQENQETSQEKVQVNLGTSQEKVKVTNKVKLA